MLRQTTYANGPTKSTATARAMATNTDGGRRSVADAARPGSEPPIRVFGANGSLSLDSTRSYQLLGTGEPFAEQFQVDGVDREGVEGG